MAKPIIYLSYTFADGQPAYFRVLEGPHGLELVKKAAPIMNRTATVLHQTGTGSDPAMEIVCVTDKTMSREVAEAVGQDAINYAMENGLLRMRED